MKVISFFLAILVAATAVAEISVTIDPSVVVGKIKPMNAVNNGPCKAPGAQSRGNFEAYRAARFPYARTHDSLDQADSNGHTVDISAVFPNFAADENDPASYDFAYTDAFLSTIFAAGTEPFFRLGQTIENGIKKYHVKPPKDFAKWARVCEHVMAHYLEGWADGFRYDITYWEIWNEPDAKLDADREKSCQWGGTKQQFFEFYEIVAKHLKKRFPRCKIGGPSLIWRSDWMKDFLVYQHRVGAPLDFFSWHVYSGLPRLRRDSVLFRKMLDENGYPQAESILNEWNFIKDWTANYPYSCQVMSSPKGGAFVAAMMIAAQHRPVDMLMYYDARPATVFNGLFDFYTFNPRPAYYAFTAWADLRDLGRQVRSHVAVTGGESKDDVETVAAVGEDGTVGLLLARFCIDDNRTAPETVTIRSAVGRFAGRIRASLTDAGHLGSDFPLFAEPDGSVRFELQPNAFIFLSGRTVK